MLKMIDWVPGWLWALMLSAVVVHSGVQGASINQLTVKLATTQAALTNRIAAEALAVAQALTKARSEEQARQAKQEELINELHAKNAAAAADLDDARQRVRLAIYGIAPGASGRELPARPGLALRTQNPAGTDLQEADRDFADRLLELAAEADEVVRERSMCIFLR